MDLNWKIEELNIKNINNKEIKYKVEMRKENKKFNKIYEGNDNNYKIEKLKKDRNYEFRICSLYNDIISCWSEIKKNKNT